jgi:hypothetical protein
MYDFLEILKYILPSVVVFFTTYFVIKLFFENEYKKKQSEFRQMSGNVTIPIRLQAYERLVLFLERISPGSLLIRVYNNNFSASQFQMTLIRSIREEFEHNLSQQVYVSSQAWELVKNAKEEMLKLINITMGELNDNASSSDLSKKIFEKSILTDKFPVAIATEHLKNEIRQLF